MNNRNKDDEFYKLNKSIIYIRLKACLGYKLCLTIRIRLIYTSEVGSAESKTYKSQMYGYNAGQPVSSLYTVLSDMECKDKQDKNKGPANFVTQNLVLHEELTAKLHIAAGPRYLCIRVICISLHTQASWCHKNH